MLCYTSTSGREHSLNLEQWNGNENVGITVHTPVFLPRLFLVIVLNNPEQYVCLFVTRRNFVFCC